MRITIQIKKFYDWQPLPAGVQPTKADIKALRVKPTVEADKWLMRVERDQESHTAIGLPESEIVNLMAHQERRGAPKRRAAVVAQYLEEHTMPHHAHVKHFVSIDVDDDGPNPDLYRAFIGQLKDEDGNPLHTEAELAGMVDRYAADKGDVEAFLNQYFETVAK